MINDEKAFFTNLNQIIICLNEGQMDKATELLDMSESELSQIPAAQDFLANFRRFISTNKDSAAFINAISTGNLDVNPPDDPLRKNFVISRYKQMHSNLLHLTWQVQQIAKGDLKQKVSFMGEFSIAFNKMIEALREKEVMEEKIRLQNKELQNLNASKDKFFSIIAHDLRGPLGGLMGLSEIIADEANLLSPDEKQEMIRVLSRSARNIYNLLENLLDWSQMQQGHTAFKPQVSRLEKLVTESAKLLFEVGRRKDISVTVDIDKDQEVFADKNMFQSVIRNLVSNAIKFTPKGGKVIITTGLTENKSSLITVKDSGIGMNSEMVSNLFRLNVNSSRPGTEGENSTGLGLLLCKEFVERHGGEIWVESEVGNGSSFCFTIPDTAIKKEVDLVVKPDASLDETGHLRNLKVLIAEDNENSEILIRIVISPFSHQVLETGTGTDAIKICRNNPDIDLILMDINMPEMDGLEATRQIRKFNKDVVIIAQTAFGQSDTREKALAAGCNDYIPKPIDIEELLRIIRKQFEVKLS